MRLRGHFARRCRTGKIGNLTRLCGFNPGRTANRKSGAERMDHLGTDLQISAQRILGLHVRHGGERRTKGQMQDCFLLTRKEVGGRLAFDHFYAVDNETPLKLRCMSLVRVP